MRFNGECATERSRVNFVKQKMKFCLRQNDLAASKKDFTLSTHTAASHDILLFQFILTFSLFSRPVNQFVFLET